MYEDNDDTIDTAPAGTYPDDMVSFSAGGEDVPDRPEADDDEPWDEFDEEALGELDEGAVSFGGARARIAGRVCMDQTMVDVTDLPEVGEGSTAVLFGGAGISADEAASWLGTINYEVTCLVAPRVPRVYMG